MATLTVYTVANGEGGLYRERIETFADARAGTVADTEITIASPTTFLQTWTSGSYHPIRRGYFPYDTSALTSGAVISAATLSIYGGSGTINDNSSAIYIVQSTQASATDLVVEDYDQLGSVDFSTNIPYASWNTAGYNDFALNASGLANISKTGYSMFGALDKLDFLNTGPATSNNSIAGYFSPESGTSKDPKLVITYSFAYTQSLNEVVTIVSSLAKATTRSLSEVVTVVDAITRAITRSFSQAIAIVDTLTAQRVVTLVLAEVVTITDAITRAITRTFSEIMTIVDSISNVAAHMYTKETKPTTSYTKESKPTTIYTKESK